MFIPPYDIHGMYIRVVEKTKMLLHAEDLHPLVGVRVRWPGLVKPLGWKWEVKAD